MGPHLKQLCVAQNNKTNDYKTVIKTGSKTKALHLNHPRSFLRSTDIVTRRSFLLS